MSMAIFLFDTVFLGNFADTYIDETDQNAENAADLLGAYSNIPKTQLTVDDADDDNVIFDNEFLTPDTISYDTGSGTITVALDSSIEYMATITRGDGTTYSESVSVYQMDNGDVFVLGDIFEGENIQAIELTSVIKSDFGGASARDKTYNFDVVCLTSGTMIQTRSGETPVETLKEGDLVQTLSDGCQPVLMTGSQSRKPRPETAPITFAKGCLGANTPKRTLRVSPQHRMLVTSPVAYDLLGCPHAYIPAKKLAGVDGVSKGQGVQPVTYWHLLFERHQSILANGTWVESLLIAPMSMRALPMTSRLKLHGLHRKLHPVASRTPEFPILKGKSLSAFLTQSRQTQIPMVSPALFEPTRQSA